MKEHAITLLSEEEAENVVYITCNNLDLSEVGSDVVFADGVRIEFLQSIDIVQELPPSDLPERFTKPKKLNT